MAKFTLIGDLHDFTDAPIRFDGIRVIATPSKKNNPVEDKVHSKTTILRTNPDGSFSVELITLPGLYYTVMSDSQAFNPVTFAAPAEGATVRLHQITNEDPEPSYTAVSLIDARGVPESYVVAADGNGGIVWRQEGAIALEALDAEIAARQAHEAATVNVHGIRNTAPLDTIVDLPDLALHFENGLI